MDFFAKKTDIMWPSVSFSVHYQPRFHAGAVQTPTKVEALLRSNANITTERLISMLEANGVIAEVTLFVVRTACSDIKRLQSALGYSPGVSINISPELFNNTRFFLETTKILEEHDVPSEMIEFEITETQRIHDIKRVSAQVRSIRQDGFGVALDDFGVGQSGLFYLNNIDASSIKIDRHFIDGLGKEKTSEVIVSNVARIAADLGIEAVAEGIETADQMDFAVSAGYSELQGFLLAKPMTIMELAAFLRSAKPRQQVNPLVATTSTQPHIQLPEGFRQPLI